MGVCPACISMLHCLQCSEGVGYPGPGVTGDSELLCGC